MGHPKALLKLGNQTFLERILHTVSIAGLSGPVVVAGHHYREIAQALPTLPLVFNPNYEQGMSTSVQAGVRALGPEAEGAGLFLVDHPLIEPETVRVLSERLLPGRIVLPVYGGRRGHPAFFSGALFPEILALSPDQGLNTVVRRDQGRVDEVPVASSSVLEDIDTPEAFEKLLRDQE